MKLRNAFLVAGLGVLLAAPEARASNFKDFSNRCTPGALRACVSIQLITQDIGSGTRVTLRVQNTQGWGPSWLGDNTSGSMVRKIGLVAPNITSVSNFAITNSGGTTTGNPASFWSISSPGSLGGQIEMQVAAGPGLWREGSISGCGAPVPSVGSFYSTCGGGWIEFSFDTAEDWTADQGDIAWIIDINGSSDTHCGTFATPEGENGGRVECSMVTPEPVSMVLIGTGIASMGGVGMLRRRRKNNSEIESV